MTAGLFSIPTHHSGMRHLAQTRNPEMINARFRVRANARPGKTIVFDSAYLIELNSQKALRIDVDLELEIAFGLWAGRQPFAQIFLSLIHI